MDISAVKYRLTDPQAKGFQAVRDAFSNQVAYCRDNGAPITALVCQAVFELLDTDRGGAFMESVRRWDGPALADALPLRVAGGLHALHLSGQERSLAPLYQGSDRADALLCVATAIENNQSYMKAWLAGPPQTNEAGRAWAFAAAMLWLTDQGLPNQFSINEIGSSAGITLMMDRFAFDLGGVRLGPQNSPISLAPDWHGPAPPDHRVRIVSAKGCDLAPIDLCDPEHAARLKAYVWSDMTDRMARMDAAIAMAKQHPPHIEPMRAAHFVDRILNQSSEAGVTRMICHSVVWQYIPEDERRAIENAIVKAGAAASQDKPLAWVSLEANRDTHRHELRVRYWPGGASDALLATAHPHGAHVEWLAG